ncbi:hypothetical protein BKA83DRAFT_4485273 [Pisolithus microcarpus]|nr:hypothetical protein BKA83DRAFT_4493270 [Pisolithus microcarpus]KAI6036203.1 hypothetical protein BKA83DRAFT_4485273 [Pisolithus microcarpus]
MSVGEIHQVVGDFLHREMVNLVSDWLGSTGVQKLLKEPSSTSRLAMPEGITSSCDDRNTREWDAGRTEDN